MICPNCEKEIASNIAQCPYCGCRFPVKELPKPPVVKQQPQPVQLPPATTPVSPPIPMQENNLQNADAATIQGKNCPICKKLINATAAFCRFCGTSMASKDTTENIETIKESMKTCQNCNNPVSANATFCKWCGQKQE